MISCQEARYEDSERSPRYPPVPIIWLALRDTMGGPVSLADWASPGVGKGPGTRGKGLGKCPNGRVRRLRRTTAGWPLSGSVATTL